MRWISKARTLLQESAGGNELPKKEAGSPVQIAAQQLRSDIVPRFADLFELLAERQRQPVLGLARDETPIGRTSAASGTRVDRAAQPAFARPREGLVRLPPPTSPSWQSVPIRARFADPAPVAGATGRPADRPGPPTPSATGRPLPPSPSAPAPADRPSANRPTAFSASPAAAQCWANSAGCASTISGKRSSRVAAIRACSRWRRLRSKVP